MSNETVKCSFPEAESGEANILAEDLSGFLSEEVDDVELRRERTDPRSQDFGATLVVILATPAVTALVRGFSKWLARRSDAKLHLERVDQKGKKRVVTVNGQLGDRADKLIRDFFTDESQ